MAADTSRVGADLSRGRPARVWIGLLEDFTVGLGVAVALDQVGPARAVVRARDRNVEPGDR